MEDVLFFLCRYSSRALGAEDTVSTSVYQMTFSVAATVSQVLVLEAEQTLHNLLVASIHIIHVNVDAVQLRFNVQLKHILCYYLSVVYLATSQAYEFNK